MWERESLGQLIMAHSRRRWRLAGGMHCVPPGWERSFGDVTRMKLGHPRSSEKGCTASSCQTQRKASRRWAQCGQRKGAGRVDDQRTVGSLVCRCVTSVPLGVMLSRAKTGAFQNTRSDLEGSDPQRPVKPPTGTAVEGW